MSKKEYISLPQFVQTASEEELQATIARVKKRFKLFGLLSLIPGLNIFLMGCTIFCYNNLSILKSRGAKNGSNFLRFLMLLWGFIIIPLIEIQLFAHITSLGAKVIDLDD